jgi:hypothetical protein
MTPAILPPKPPSQPEEEKEEVPPTTALLAAYHRHHKKMVKFKNMVVEYQFGIATDDMSQLSQGSGSVIPNQKFPLLLQPSMPQEEEKEEVPLTRLVIEYDANHNKVYQLVVAAPDEMTNGSASFAMSSSHGAGLNKLVVAAPDEMSYASASVAMSSSQGGNCHQAVVAAPDKIQKVAVSANPDSYNKYYSLLQPSMPQEEGEEEKENYEILLITRDVNEFDDDHNLVYQSAVAPDEMSSHGSVESPVSSGCGTLYPDESLSLLLDTADEMTHDSVSVPVSVSVSVSATSCRDGGGGGDGFNPDESLSLLLDTSDVNLLRLRICQETNRLRQKIQTLQARRSHAYTPQAFSWHANQPGWRPQPTSSKWMGTKEAQAFPKTWNCPNPFLYPYPKPNQSPYQSRYPPHSPQVSIATTTTATTTKSEWGEEEIEEHSRMQRLKDLAQRCQETLLRAEF